MIYISSTSASHTQSITKDIKVFLLDDGALLPTQVLIATLFYAAAQKKTMPAAAIYYAIKSIYATTILALYSLLRLIDYACATAFHEKQRDMIRWANILKWAAR